MIDDPSPSVMPSFPLVSLEGPACDCGREYGDMVLRKYPGYRRYLDMAFDWRELPANVRSLVERRAPYLIDLYRGLLDVAGRGPASPAPTPAPPKSGCTSFGISGTLTADGHPLSGQTKDTPPDRLPLYIVLRIRISSGPTILVLAYPGEILGYGLWSTGMSLFRNDLNSRPSTTGQLTMVQWALLALAGTSVHDAAQLAEQFGIADAGNCLLSDASGESLSVEFNAGGVAIIPPTDGIAIHTNHPCARPTAPFEDYPDATDRAHSRYRQRRLRALLDEHRGRITPQSVFTALADHGEHAPPPSSRRGICRHLPESTTGIITTAAVIAQPAARTLHVVPGQPCQNRPTAYTP